MELTDCLHLGFSGFDKENDDRGWRILQRLELNRLPVAQKHKTYQKRWKQFEKPQPGDAIQMDVKFITLLVAPGNASTSSPPSTTAPDCES